MPRSFISTGPRCAAGRSRAMPHIKTYARVCSDGRVPWLLLTSSNLSEQRSRDARDVSAPLRSCYFMLSCRFLTVAEGKPAWGSWTKGDGKFGCLSFELGVFMEKGEGGWGAKDGWPLPYDVEDLEVPRLPCRPRRLLRRTCRIMRCRLMGRWTSRGCGTWIMKYRT